MFNIMNSKKIKPFVPIIAMFGYILIMSVSGLIFKSRIAIGAFIGDLATILIFGYIYYKSKLRRSTTPLFKPQTWFYALAIGFLGLVWISSQTAANE